MGKSAEKGGMRQLERNDNKPPIRARRGRKKKGRLRIARWRKKKKTCQGSTAREKDVSSEKKKPRRSACRKERGRELFASPAQFRKGKETSVEKKRF